MVGAHINVIIQVIKCVYVEAVRQKLQTLSFKQV